MGLFNVPATRVPLRPASGPDTITQDPATSAQRNRAETDRMKPMVVSPTVR